MVCGAASDSPKVLHLAGSNECLHRARHVLDRHLRIDAVLVEQVNGLHLQASQHFVNDLPDVIGPAVQATGALSGLRVDVPAELGRNRHVHANGRNRFADETLVGKWAVDFGRIEVGDAPLERGADETAPLRPVGGGSIDLLESHATVANRRDDQTVLAKCSRLHVLIILRYRAASSAAPSCRSRATSRVGALPNNLVYSRLNCDALR